MWGQSHCSPHLLLLLLNLLLLLLLLLQLLLHRHAMAIARLKRGREGRIFQQDAYKRGFQCVSTCYPRNPALETSKGTSLAHFCQQIVRPHLRVICYLQSCAQQEKNSEQWGFNINDINVKSSTCCPQRLHTPASWRWLAAIKASIKASTLSCPPRCSLWCHSQEDPEKNKANACKRWQAGKKQKKKGKLWNDLTSGTCDSIWCQRFTAHSHCIALKGFGN